MMEATYTIAIFAKVAELGSISGAARTLGLPKASVSRAVTRLETTYQVALTDRTSRRVRLTEIGQSFYERCQRVLAELDEASAEIAAFRGHPSGILRVGCSGDVARGAIGPHLHEFLLRFPDIDLRVRVGERLIPEPGKMDVVLHAGWLSDSRYVARKISGVLTLMVASKAYLAERGVPRTIEDLAAHDVIGNYYMDRAASEQGRLPAHVPTLELTKDGQRFQVPIWPRFASTDHSLMLELVRNGVAITGIGAVHIMDELKSGELVRILPDYRIYNPAGLYALYTNRAAVAPKVTAFIDFLTEKAASQADTIRHLGVLKG